MTEDTQHSIFLQKEIEEFTTEMKTDKHLPNPRNAPITHRVHDQRTTSLCVSYSTTTILRGAVIHILVKNGQNDAQIRADLENTNDYSFTKMLTLFTGCVSPRSLDGLVFNSRNNPGIMGAQIQVSETAIDRLVNKTEFEEEGWIRIGPVVEILQKYNVDPKKIELEKFIVYHPKVAGGRMNFHDAIGQKMLILTQIFNNTLSSVKSPDDNNSHAVTLFGFDQNNFQIKNSYFVQKLVEVNSQIPVYSEFINFQQWFRQVVPQNLPTFSDQSYILLDHGYCVQFKNK